MSLQSLMTFCFLFLIFRNLHVFLVLLVHPQTYRQYFHEFSFADHLLQFLVIKDFRVSYRLKHQQIFKNVTKNFSMEMNLEMKLIK